MAQEDIQTTELDVRLSEMQRPPASDRGCVVTRWGRRKPTLLCSVASTDMGSEPTEPSPCG